VSSVSLNIHFRTWHSSRVLATHAVKYSNRHEIFSFSRGQVRCIVETLRELSYHGIQVTVGIACGGWYSSNVDRMTIVHIAWPLCFEVVFPHKFAAAACSNISVKDASEFGGRPNKSCSVA
jgi:hypothetical protein